MKAKLSSIPFTAALILFFALFPLDQSSAQTITNLPAVTVGAIDATAAEAGSDPGVFRFKRSGDLAESLTVYYSISGLASNGVDYANISDSITFPATVSNINLTITPIDDLVLESHEGVVLTLKTNAAYKVENSFASAVVTIRDNDNHSPTIHFLSPTNNSLFLQPTNIVLQAEASDSDGVLRRVEFYKGTSLIGTVLGHDSPFYNLIWTNPPSGNYTLTARAIDNFEARATSGPVNITISNTLPMVKIVAADSVASESGDTATFKIYRFTTNENLTVFYFIDGAASNGVDYATISSSVTIPAGSSNALVTISPTDDALIEGTEAVVLTIKSNIAYRYEGSWSATANIQDNDVTNVPPTVRIYSPTNSSIFFAPTNITIYAHASDSNGSIATVEFFIGTNRLGTVTNNPGSATSANAFFITWTNPPLGEFVLSARATDNTGLMAVSDPVNISIREKQIELPVVTIETIDHNAAETPPFSTIASNPGIFKVRRTPVSGHALFVNYGIEGTAANGADYNTLSGSITIPANESYALFHVNPIDDTTIEGTETVVLHLRTNVGYLLGTARQATVYIEDNDRVTNPAPTIRITAPSNNAVFIAPTNILITAEASDTNGQVVRVDFFVGDKFVGSDSNAPYEILWTNALPGYYHLGAKATDNEGAFGYAPGVHVTVRSPNEIAFVKRTLPLWYVPGVKLVVRLRAEPPAGTTSYSFTDQPPTNWTIGVISHNGTISAPNQVTFGPFNDGLARSLTYEVTPPPTELGEKHFSGSAMANGTATPVGGNKLIVHAPPHPADNIETNFSIGEAELSAYVSAWKRCERWKIAPNPIPINYVTRAGFLFAVGGGYTFSTRFPTPYPPLLWVSTSIAETNSWNASGTIGWSTDGPGRAISSMPTNYFPGLPFNVTIAITPSSNTLSYGLEERPPEGWGITNISNGGIFCPATGKIRWGLFLTNGSLTVSYQVTPRTNTTTSSATFAGVASFNGLNVPITGQRTTRYSAVTTGTAAKLQSISPMANGDRLMTFLGVAGVEYVIEASSNFIDWTPLGSLLNNDGLLQYIDIAGDKLEQRFYRVIPAQ